MKRAEKSMDYISCMVSTNRKGRLNYIPKTLKETEEVIVCTPEFFYTMKALAESKKETKKADTIRA
jgi:hypothetical protein